MESGNDFINSWQENFQKMLSSPEMLQQFSNMSNLMQQFYGKPTNITNPFEFGVTQPCGGDVISKIQELEQRVTQLELSRNYKRKSKKTA